MKRKDTSSLGSTWRQMRRYRTSPPNQYPGLLSDMNRRTDDRAARSGTLLASVGLRVPGSHGPGRIIREYCMPYLRIDLLCRYAINPCEHAQEMEAKSAEHYLSEHLHHRIGSLFEILLFQTHSSFLLPALPRPLHLAGYPASWPLQGYAAYNIGVGSVLARGNVRWPT